MVLMSHLSIADTHANTDEQFTVESNSAEFLDPDQAFKLTMAVIDRQTLKASFSVAPGYYLYRQRMNVQLQEGSLAEIVALNFPQGEMKHDANFGESEVYHDAVDVIASLAPLEATQTAVTVRMSYQGCSEQGLCYSPINKTLTLDLSSAALATVVSGNTITATDTKPDDKANTLLSSGNLWLIVLGFFGFGLLLSLTPCVFPMIPILSGIIVGQGENQSKMHSFYLSVAYTLGMAVSYTLAGIAAGFSGHLISAALQNPWVLGSSALVFVTLSLSMFGFYELKLPGSFESGVIKYTNRIKGGKFAGVFTMGALSALIVSPCVAAPLAGALIYIGQTHDVVLGGAALFSLSLGMGVPLLILGASAGALLPRAGAWMETVRHFFGVLMLAMAIWLITPVIPEHVTMLLWAALLIISSIYLHALDALPITKTNWDMFWKGTGVMILLFGVSLFVGSLTGSTDPLQPLAGLQSVAHAKQSPTDEIHFKRVKNIAELDAAIVQAKGQHVMLDFYADWCASCKEYEKYTFRDDKVKQQLGQFVLLQVDVTENNADDTALLKRFQLFGPPGIMFYNKAGQQIPSATVIGYQNASEFSASLQQILL